MEVMDSIIEHLSYSFQIQLREDDFLDQEIARAAEIAEMRFGNERWLHRR